MRVAKFLVGTGCLLWLLPVLLLGSLLISMPFVWLWSVIFG